MSDPRTTYWCQECETTVGVRRIAMTLPQIPFHGRKLRPVTLSSEARHLTVIGACGHSGSIVSSEENIVAMRRDRAEVVA